jgi:hypothetical protein
MRRRRRSPRRIFSSPQRCRGTHRQSRRSSQAVFPSTPRVTRFLPCLRPRSLPMGPACLGQHPESTPQRLRPDDLSAQDYTALHNATRNGHTALVEMLVAHKADINAKTNAQVRARSALAKTLSQHKLRALRSARCPAVDRASDRSIVWCRTRPCTLLLSSAMQERARPW